MRRMSRKRAVIAVAWLLLSLPAGPVLAASASLSVLFTNHGEPLDDPLSGRFYIYEEGKREHYLTWGSAARSARVEEGVYDIVIRYVNDTIVEERVLESFELRGDVVHEQALEVVPAHLTIEITAGGAPISVHSGSYDVHLAGSRGKPIAARRPGERLTLRPGRYDIEVRYRDPRGLQSTWLRNYLVVDEHLETVDIGVAAARLSVSMTYRGVPLSAGQGEWDAHRRGDPQALTGGESGDRVELPAGTYDLRAVHTGPDGARIERWVRDVQVEGNAAETIELEQAGSAGAIRAEQWLRNRSIDGPTELEAGLSLSTATLTIRAPHRIRNPIERSGVLIVLDSSLEMGAPMGSRSRIDLVRQMLLDTIDALDSDSIDVGLRVWGIAPQSQNNCRDSTLLMPLAPFDRRGTETALSLIRPSGFTPIAHSLLAAVDDLPTDGRSSVIVLTSGTDDCSGDPCDAAARLIKRGRADRIHVIGLDPPIHAETELSCVGTYHGASDRAQLRNSLREIFGEVAGADRGRVAVFLPGRNRWVASAELDQPIELLEGRYDLLVRAGDSTYHWNDFEVRGDTNATAGPKP